MRTRFVSPDRRPSAWLLVAVAVLGVAYCGDHWGEAGGWLSAAVLAAMLIGVAFGAWLTQDRMSELRSLPDSTPDGRRMTSGSPNSDPEPRQEPAPHPNKQAPPDANEYPSRLRGAKLTQAQLFKADLTRADLTGADLTGADLRGADLSGADLSGAVLRDAKLGPPRPSRPPADEPDTECGDATL